MLPKQARCQLRTTLSFPSHCLLRYKRGPERQTLRPVFLLYWIFR